MTLKTIKDYPEESRLVQTRVLLAIGVVFFMSAILVGRAFYLQIIRHDALATQSEDNRIHLRPLPPVRGLIYDTKGRLLADNRPSYTLTVIRERVTDLETTLNELQELLDLPDTDVSAFREAITNRRPFNSVVLKSRLTEEEIAKIAVNQHRFPGVNIEAQLYRYYPFNKAVTHAVGYVGRINRTELKKIQASLYSGTNIIGKIGVERFYETKLLGKPGYQEVESNARGRVLRVLHESPPVQGKDVHLYLDLDLQQATLKALEGRRGAVVALDPNSGGVLALVSSPAYDANAFVGGISHQKYSLLRNNINRPLYNRATLGEYPPASTLKPFMALAALASDTIDEEYQIYDKGYFKLPGDSHRYRNWKRQGDGWTNLVRSIARSNDTYYYDIAVKMGIDTIHKYMSMFGFGARTGLDIASERAGLMPSRRWKRTTRGLPWYPGETVISGIGQGYMLTTPLQLAVATSVIANRGRARRPRLAKPEPGAPEPNDTIMVNKRERDWDTVIEGMRAVVHSPTGTAHKRMGKNLKYTVAGKTGTAQVVGLP